MTAAASGVASTSTTLNGVVTPDGQDLTPSTQYFLRLDTTTSLAAATHGQEQSFTAPPAAPSITVDRAATTTRIIASANPALRRQTVTYTARVTRSGSGTGAPTGTVAFSDGAAPIHCIGGSQLLHGTGEATCTVTYRVRGAHSIIATYQGDAHFAGSQSQTLSEIVISGRHHAHRTRAVRRVPIGAGRSSMDR